MKIVLASTAAFLCGITVGAIVQAKRMHDEVDEAKASYADSYDKLVREGLIDSAFKKAGNKIGEDVLVGIRKSREEAAEQVKLLKDAVDEVEALQEQKINESLVESAADLIQRVGYNQMSEKKPAAEAVAPKGPTTSSVPAISELPTVIDLYEYDQTDDPRYREWEQYTLTYYVGDNTLVSQTDSVIEGKDLVRTVGDLLGSFPEGGDSLYIRNPILKMDFEVVRDPRSYADVRGD